MKVSVDFGSHGFSEEYDSASDRHYFVSDFNTRFISRYEPC